MCAAPAGKLYFLCVFVSYSTESTHYLAFISVLGCFPAKESWREHMWCLRQLHSLSSWKGARRGARVVAPGPIFRYLGVALPPPISGAACGRRRRSQQPSDFIPIGNFLVKTRGCGGCSQWEGGVERNLGLVASTWPQACTRYNHPPYAIDMLCLYSTTGLETRFRNCTALRLGRRQYV
jgi:hypothetical protein